MKSENTQWICTLMFSMLLTVPSLAQQDNEGSKEESSWEYKYSYEELKEIAQKEHDPNLKIEELKFFLKPGIYEIKYTLTSNRSGTNGKQTKEFTEMAKIKYVDGRFIILTPERKTDIWALTTYNRDCECYRGWQIVGNRKDDIEIAIGNRSGNSRTISWTSHIPGRNQIGNWVEHYSKNRKKKTSTATYFQNGRFIRRVEMTTEFVKPLEDVDDKTGQKKTKEF